MPEQVDLHIVEFAAFGGIAQQRLGERLVDLGDARLGVEEHRRHRVIHQPFAHARQIDDRLDAQRRQLGGRPDSRTEQDRRTLNRSGRNDDLLGPHRLQFAARVHPQPYGPPVLDQYAIDQTAAAQGQVESMPRRRQVAEIRRPAHHPAAIHRQRRNAGALRIVLVVGLLEAQRDAGVVEAALHRLHLLALPAHHRDRPALAVKVAALVLIVLKPPEVGQALGPGPARVAGQLGPAVVVAGRAADRHAGVDRGGAADQLAARHRLIAARHVGGAEAPVVLLHRRLVDAGHIFGQRLHAGEVGPRLEQQHGAIGVLAEPRGQHRAGRTRARHDHVVFHHRPLLLRSAAAARPH